MRPLFQLTLALLLTAAYVPAAAWGPAGIRPGSGGSAFGRPSAACCGPQTCCEHGGTCASTETCAAVNADGPSGAAEQPGEAKLCAGRCASDPARVTSGDPDPWVLQIAAGPGSYSPLDAVPGAAGDPIARALLPAVPPPRA